MTFSVIRSARDIIGPSGQTPSGTLDLSFIDKLPYLQTYIRTLHVFRHGHEAAKVIREALSKALVPYYPLAGRLKKSSEGELQIACTGEGIWFVEASANCSLDAINYIDNIHMVPLDELLPDLPTESAVVDSLVIMQVTQFTCGGFVMGLKFCHTICDGLGAAQFLKAVGEFARGLQHPSIEPVWYREALPAPPQQKHMTTQPRLPPRSPPPMPDYKLEHASIDISQERINQLKHEFLESTGGTCSTFEVVVASVWSCRTRSINLEKDTQVKLVFLASGRQLMHPPLPEGFYGNCFFPVYVTASAETLARASISEVVELIQEAKGRLSSEFAKYLNGDHVEAGDNPYDPSVLYTRLVISEWGRLGFNHVDYGWGPPVHMLPIQDPGIIPMAFFGSPPTPKKGIRLMTWSVKPTHLPHFLEQMMSLT